MSSLPTPGPLSPVPVPVNGDAPSRKRKEPDTGVVTFIDGKGGVVWCIRSNDTDDEVTFVVPMKLFQSLHTLDLSGFILEVTGGPSHTTEVRYWEKKFTHLYIRQAPDDHQIMHFTSDQFNRKFIENVSGYIESMKNSDGSDDES